MNSIQKEKLMVCFEEIRKIYLEAVYGGENHESKLNLVFQRIEELDRPQEAIEKSYSERVCPNCGSNVTQSSYDFRFDTMPYCSNCDTKIIRRSW